MVVPVDDINSGNVKTTLRQVRRAGAKEKKWVKKYASETSAKGRQKLKTDIAENTELNTDDTMTELPTCPRWSD